MLDWTGSNYRITFFWSAAFSLAALVLLLYVHRRFMSMGGPEGYQAPLDTPPEEAMSRGFDVVPTSGTQGKH